MPFNTSPVNWTKVNGAMPERGRPTLGVASTIYARGQATLQVTQKIIYGQGAAVTNITTEVFAKGQTQADFEQRINHGTGLEALDILHSVYARGITSLHIQQRINQGTGGYSVPITQQIDAKHGFAGVFIEQVIGEQGSYSLDIQQEITNPKGAASLGIQQEIKSKGTYSTGIEQHIYQSSNATQPSSSAGWRVSAKVVLDGTDISENVTGLIRVEAEEGAARIAEFVYDPDPSTLNITDLVAVPLLIYAGEGANAAGANAAQRLVFQGIVDVPDYDPVTQLIKINATDNLQGRFNSLTREKIETEIGGYWSVHLFSEDSQGWDYMQERMSTQNYSYDLDVGLSGVKSPWGIMGGASFTYTEDDVYDESLSFSFASIRDIINEVKIGIDFRFQRLRAREEYVRWMYTQAWCDYLVQPWDLPTKDMLKSAVESTGWALRDISYTDTPSPGWYQCSAWDAPRFWSPAPYGTSEADATKYALGFAAHIQKRWAQTVTEKYEIRVVSNSSIAQFGASTEHIEIGVEAEQDISAWEQGDEFLSISSMPLSISSGQVAATESGDDILDADEATVAGGRSEMENAQLTAIHKAKALIKDSHRNNYVTFSVPVEPSIERHHLISLGTSGVTAQGKVHSFIHSIDMSEGYAYTEITLSLSKIQATGVDSNITVVPSPDTEPKVVPDGEDPGSIGYNSSLHIGGKIDSVDFNEAWRGLITNYMYDSAEPDSGFSSSPPPAKIYPSEFRYEAPAISEEDRQEVVGLVEDAQGNETTTEIEVSVPDELMTIVTT